MGHELAIGACLVLVFEGLLPFISPTRLRIAAASVASLNDRTLRIIGLLSMVLGTSLLYLVNS